MNKTLRLNRRDNRSNNSIFFNKLSSEVLKKKKKKKNDTYRMKVKLVQYDYKNSISNFSANSWNGKALSTQSSRHCPRHVCWNVWNMRHISIYLYKAQIWSQTCHSISFKMFQKLPNQSFHTSIWEQVWLSKHDNMHQNMFPCPVPEP